MKVQVCLEIGPSAAGVFVPDYPRCWVFSRNQESVLDKAKAAVKERHSWARAHGEVIETLMAVEIEPAEIMHVAYNPAKAGKPEPLFWSEVLPVSTEDINRTLRLMAYSRHGLLRLCSAPDGRALRWKPRREPRTVGNRLRRIAIVEWWYITRLDIDLPRDFPRDAFQLLQYTRQLATRGLRNLSKEGRSGVFQPERDPSPTCNLWTARKVLRRFVDHERLHTSYIRRVIQLYESSGTASGAPVSKRPLQAPA